MKKLRTGRIGSPTRRNWTRLTLACVAFMMVSASTAGAQENEPPVEKPDEEIQPSPDTLGDLFEQDREVFVVDPPPEYAVGAFPADSEDVIKLQTDARETIGLPADRKTVVELITTPGAIDQIRQYGTVLTATEESEAELLSKQDAEIDVLMDSVSSEPGYAGGKLIWNPENPRVREGIVLWSTKDTAAVLTDRAKTSPVTGVKVTIEIVDHSWAELEGWSEQIRDAVAKESRDLLPEQFQSLLGDAIENGDVWTTAYSIARNTVIVETTEVGLLEDLAAKQETPRVEFRLPSEDSPDSNPCEKAGCGPSRGGIEIEYKNSAGYCTLGFGVVRNGVENYLTAGHCDTSTIFDLQMRNWPGLAHNKDVQLGVSTGAQGFVNNSSFDGRQIVLGNHLVTNRGRTNGNPGTRFTSTQARNNTLLQSRVCRSGANTNHSCGDVLDIGETTSLEGRTFPNQVMTAYFAVGGDSGSPVYMSTNNSRLAGSHSATGVRGGVTRRFFSSVSHLGSVQAGLSVYQHTDKRRDWVLGLYEILFKKLPAWGEFNYWRNTINGGSSCNFQKAQDTAWVFLTNGNFQTVNPTYNITDRKKDQIRLMYWALLGRQPYSSEVTSWLAVYNANGANAVAYSIIFSAEFSTRFWSGASAYDGDIC